MICACAYGKFKSAATGATPLASMEAAEIPHPPGLVPSESMDLIASLSEASAVANSILKDVR